MSTLAPLLRQSVNGKRHSGAKPNLPLAKSWMVLRLFLILACQRRRLSICLVKLNIRSTDF